MYTLWKKLRPIVRVKRCLHSDTCTAYMYHSANTALVSLRTAGVGQPYNSE